MLKRNKTKMSALMLTGVCAMILTVCSPALGAANADDKPAIVLVAFGTSVDSARQVFDYIDRQAKKRYEGYDLRWAFTSQMIIDKLKKRGIVTRNVAEVVADLRREGVTSVVFQSLHVVPGEEYKSVTEVDMSGLKVAFGDALMTTDEDIDAVVRALGRHIDPARPTVVVAHGNDRHRHFNERLVALAEVIEKQYPKLVVASVEGLPGTAPLQRTAALAAKEGSVRFVPLMIVAGDHIMNDVMGDEEESWKRVVGAGTSECVASLGWNDDILAIYFDHLDKALEALGKERG